MHFGAQIDGLDNLKAMSLILEQSVDRQNSISQN